MSISLNSIRRGKIQVKALRAMLGMRGHAPSNWNVQIGKCMHDGGYSPDQGGRNDATFQGHFITCAMNATTLSGGRAKIGEAARRKAVGGGGGGRSRRAPAGE